MHKITQSTTITFVFIKLKVREEEKITIEIKNNKNIHLQNYLLLTCLHLASLKSVTGEYSIKSGLPQ